MPKEVGNKGKRIRGCKDSFSNPLLEGAAASTLEGMTRSV